MNMQDDRTVLEALGETTSDGAGRALATILETKGSTPRKAGSKMLIEPGVGLVGTVGGGCGEAEVIQAALEVIRDGVARVVEVDLTRDLTSLSPAVCGGIMRIFVEPVRPLSGASDG